MDSVDFKDNNLHDSDKDNERSLLTQYLDSVKHVTANHDIYWINTKAIYNPLSTLVKNFDTAAVDVTCVENP
jgi:hypothetical protein